MNSIFIISLISLHKPSNLGISGFPALFSIFVFCPKLTQFFVNLRKFTGKWCSKWCSNLVHFQPDFLCFSGVTVPLKSIIFAICSAARSFLAHFIILWPATFGNRWIVNLLSDTANDSRCSFFAYRPKRNLNSAAISFCFAYSSTSVLTFPCTLEQWRIYPA